MIRTNAIIFVAADADPQSRPQVFTSATASDVTTEAANVQADGKFTASPFTGIYVQYAKLLTGCQVNNVLNDASTTVINTGASSELLWGASNDDKGQQTALVATELILPNTGNNDLDISAAEELTVTGPTANFSISGFTHPDSVVRKVIVNNTTHTMTLLNESSSSTEGNRIITGLGGNMDIPAANSATLLYLPALNGWLVTAFGQATVNNFTDPRFTVALATDFSTTADTAQDVTGMSFAIDANETWTMECTIYGSALSTVGEKFAFSGPAGCAVNGFVVLFSGTPTPEQITALGTLTLSKTMTTDARYVVIKAVFTNGATPGTIQLQVASATASSNVTVRAGSNFTAYKTS